MTKIKESAQKSFIYDPDFANALENALKSVYELRKFVHKRFEKYNPDDHYQHLAEIRRQILVNIGFFEKDGGTRKTPYKESIYGYPEAITLAHDLVIWLQRRGEHCGSEEYTQSMKPFL